MEIILLIMESSSFICEKNHVFIEEDNPCYNGGSTVWC